MKKLLALLAMSALCGALKSQHLMMSPYIEKTVAGTQYGSQLIFETKSQWSFGGFYQESLQRSEGAHSFYPFMGITVNAPLMKSQKVNFYFNLRGGFVNNNFLVIAPGMETKIKISKIISFSFLSSIRMANPSAALKINIKI